MNNESMEWTVGKRVAGGFGIGLVLLVIVTAISVWALGRTVKTYENALAQRRGLLVSVLQVESQMRGANVEFLRFLVEGDRRYSRTADSLIVAAKQTSSVARAMSNGETVLGRNLEDMNLLLDRWAVNVDSAIAAKNAGNSEAAFAIRSQQIEPLQAQLDAIVTRSIATVTRETDGMASDASNRAAIARNTLIGAAFLATLIVLLSGFLLSRSINRPLRESAQVIASSSAEILAATSEQAAGINESMAAVTETVATVDEVAQTAAQAAQRAKVLAESAQRAADSGAAGKTAVERSAKAMRAVEAEVDAIAKGIVALAGQASAIGEITSSVSDIAEQTRLLALNAAVESARAGEHGRGFAVVAAEIKALANQAKESTSQVARILGEIQRATSAAVMATEQGTKQTASATHQVAEAGEIIAQLADVASEASRTAAQISASAGQQAIGMEQIRQAISNIHDATQQHLTATRQSEMAAENLNSLGARFVRLVGASAKG